MLEKRSSKILQIFHLQMQTFIRIKFNYRTKIFTVIFISKIQEISRVEKHRAEHISRVMASKYLEQMAHDKYFLTATYKDERLKSANKLGSKKLQDLAYKALADVEKRQVRIKYVTVNVTQ